MNFLRTLVLFPAVLTAAVTVVVAQQPPQPAVPALANAFGTSEDGPDVVGIGPRYLLRATADRVTFTPVLGGDAPRSLPLMMRFVAVTYGAEVVATTASRRHRTVDGVHYDRGIVHERYQLRADGVEQTFTLATRPAGTGDLVVRLAIDSVVPGVSTTSGGISFCENGRGVDYGALLGIDAQGRTARGTIRRVANELHLALPSEFVAAASFPLTFDPLIGTSSLANSTADDGQPVAAWSPSPARWLTVWRRVVALGESHLLGCLFETDASTATPFLISGVSGEDLTLPSVAMCPAAGAFVVVWRRGLGLFGTSPVVAGRIVPANGTAIGNATQLASQVTSLTCANAFPGATSLPVAWITEAGAVQSMKVSLSPANVLTGTFPPTTLGSVPASTETISLSRTAASGPARHLAVWSKSSSVPLSLQGRAIDGNALPLGPEVQLTSSVSPQRRPSVDGRDGEFLITWESFNAILVSKCEVTTAAGVSTPNLVGATSAVTFGPIDSLTNGDLIRVDDRYIASWRVSNSLFDTVARAQVMNSDAAKIGPQLELAGPPRAGGYSRRGVPRLAARGAVALADDTALAVLEEGQAAPPFDRDVVLQFVEGAGPGGAQITLAPSCGGGGISTTNGPAVLGNSNFAFQISTGDATAPLALLSLALPTTLVPCGPCTLLPPLVLETHPMVNGFASRAFPIPLNAGVIGVELLAQWLPAFGVPGPCGLFPFLSASTVLQVTIGL